MTYIITREELEHMSVAQLQVLYNAIIDDFSRRNLSAADCPQTRITLENIQIVLRRKRAVVLSEPRF